MSVKEDLVRIGAKIISRKKIAYITDEILELRSQGLSQQEVARRLSLERTFVSRLETLGEVRKGKRLAVLGFPIKNKEELIDICRKAGIDYIWIMNNRERWEMIRSKNALEFFNLVMELLATLKQYDVIILLTSERWYRIARAFLENQVFFMEIGKTPLDEDCRVDPDRLRKIMVKLGAGVT